LHSYGWISGERFPWQGESPLVTDTEEKQIIWISHAGNRLYIKQSPHQVDHRHVPKLVLGGEDSVITLSKVIPQQAAPTCSTRVNYHSLLLFRGIQQSMKRCLQAPTVFLRGWILTVFTCLATPSPYLTGMVKGSATDIVWQCAIQSD